jgi:hypothetical protein
MAERTSALDGSKLRIGVRLRFGYDVHVALGLSFEACARRPEGCGGGRGAAQAGKLGRFGEAAYNGPQPEGKRMRKLLSVSAAILICCSSGAFAQSRCRVMDPTGTPLNVRTAPGGKIVAALPNGLLVSIVDQALDANGKPWVYIARYDDGAVLGWVFREFIACF